MNRRIFLILTVIIAGCQSGSVPKESSMLPSLEYQRPAFKFTEVVNGVYCACPTENLPAWCNAAIIVNESDVVIVDTHLSPVAATALLEELQEITPKPVRYVINTHYHFDHVFGNQIYPSDVGIIGHEFTRDAITSGNSNSGRAYDWFIDGIPSEITSLRKKLDSVSDPEERIELKQSVADGEKILVAVSAVEPTAPNISFGQHLTLYRGARKIRILFLGRGHTGGDVVVHLPREGVLITGDLMYEFIPYMGDGYFLEWIETLEHLKSLELDWVIPGHGPPFQDRNRIDYLQAYLRDFWERAQALHATGVSAAEAANRIDMRDHAKHFPEIQSIGVHQLAAVRAFELLDRNKMQ